MKTKKYNCQLINFSNLKRQLVLYVGTDDGGDDYIDELRDQRISWFGYWMSIYSYLQSRIGGTGNEGPGHLSTSRGRAWICCLNTTGHESLGNYDPTSSVGDLAMAEHHCRIDAIPSMIVRI